LAGYCFTCYDGSGTGYIDCPMSCSVDPTTADGSYIRDGDLYTNTFNPSESVTFGNFLQISILILFACISLIVWLKTDEFSWLVLKLFYVINSK